MIRSIVAALFLALFVSGASAQCVVPNAFVSGTTASAAQVNANFNAILTCLNTAAQSLPPRSYLAGLTLSTAGSSSTSGIAAGVAADSTSAAIMQLTSAYTKTTSAWAVGAGNGGLDTGTIAANTWYHVYLIERTDTGVVDVQFSLSATAPTLPTNYTLFRRIGSMKTDGSSHWIQFTQNGDQFLWYVAVNDVNVTNLSTAAVLYALSVPTGVKVFALNRGYINNATATNLLITSPDESDQSPQTVAGNNTGFQMGNNVTTPLGQIQTLTNTSAQIRARAANASTTLVLATYGWIDRRGRDF